MPSVGLSHCRNVWCHAGPVCFEICYRIRRPGALIYLAPKIESNEIQYALGSAGLRPDAFETWFRIVDG